MRTPFLLAVSLVTFLATPAAQAATVSVCADPDPPPWTYWVRDDQNKHGEAFVGFSVDTIRTAFSRLGTEVKFIGTLPWARCLKMVAAGEIDFAMDAYFDKERAKTFAYSTHYNTLTPQIFYLSPKQLSITSIGDLKRYKGCGLLGASYAHYGLKNEDMDLGVNTYDLMIKKLKAGRCDYFPEELEVIAGFKGLGRDYLADPELRHLPVSDAKSPAKHLITARGSKSEKLLPELNKALDGMIKSGEAAQIWKKHSQNSGYTP